MTDRQPPRMILISRVLEAALDAGNTDVVAACRRLRQANLRGWRRYHDPKDMAFVRHVDDLICGRA